MSLVICPAIECKRREVCRESGGHAVQHEKNTHCKESCNLMSFKYGSNESADVHMHAKCITLAEFKKKING